MQYTFFNKGRPRIIRVYFVRDFGSPGFDFPFDFQYIKGIYKTLERNKKGKDKNNG